MLSIPLDISISLDRDPLGSLAIVVAAAVAALGAVVVYVLQVRETARERKRRMCADALADALAWLELPYRVRRRTDDSSEVLAQLAQRAHDLQERLLFHRSWLCMELPGAWQQYDDLVTAIKEATREPLQQAWAHPPVTEPTDMNIERLFPLISEEHIQRFCAAASQHLRGLV